MQAQANWENQFLALAGTLPQPHKRQLFSYWAGDAALRAALQMTNILCDIGEDYRNGRLYLPREELVYYGIREQDIAGGRITDNMSLAGCSCPKIALSLTSL
ncbi:MAG: squalene/phytoene synthase family protein [Candidatus Villigracilaceae bacterium]